MNALLLPTEKQKNFRFGFRRKSIKYYVSAYFHTTERNGYCSERRRLTTVNQRDQHDYKRYRLKTVVGERFLIYRSEL